MITWTSTRLGNECMIEGWAMTLVLHSSSGLRKRASLEKNSALNEQISQ
jgi:hypothetical protein